MASPVAGWLATTLVYGSLASLGVASVLPILAGGLFFYSGIQYARGNFKAGNRISTVAATVLGVDLALQGQIIGAVCAIGLHAGGKLVGSFPEFFEKQFGNSKYRVLRQTLGSPGNASGFGPMLSRAPVGVEAATHLDPLLAIACAAWLSADFDLTKARPKPSNAGTAPSPAP